MFTIALTFVAAIVANVVAIIVLDGNPEAVSLLTITFTALTVLVSLWLGGLMTATRTQALGVASFYTLVFGLGNAGAYEIFGTATLMLGLVMLMATIAISLCKLVSRMADKTARSY